MAQDVLTYGDIAHLTDREIQMILRETDTKDLAVAMLGAEEEVNRVYFGNVSQGVGNMLREEMKSRGDVAENDILEVQFQILQTVLQLRDHGQIVWPKEEKKPSSQKLGEEYYAKKEQTTALLAEDSYLDMGCEEIVDVIVGLAEIARAEGILALEKLVDTDDDDMLLTGIRLAVDGTEPELITVILSTRKTYLIEHCATTYRMMMEGLMAIQSGDNPRIVERKLRTFYIAPPSKRTVFESVSVDDVKNRLEDAPKILWTFDEVTDLMTDLSVVTRRDGVEVLEPLVQMAKLKLLQNGLNMMVNHTEPDLVQVVMETHLEHLKPYLKVKCQMVIEGIMSIQSGDNPRFIGDKIRTFFDFD